MNNLFENDISVIQNELSILQENMKNLEKDIIGKQAILDFLLSKQLRKNDEIFIGSSGNNKTPDIPPERKNTLIDIIDNFISTLADMEFDSNYVYRCLSDTNQIEHTTSKSSVSKVLSKFAEDKKIEVAYKGGGRIPNRYKLKNKEPDDLI